jgi:hypothetical protein
VGRKVLLSASQSLQVGRTERADFSIPQDGRMSSLHFALETDNETCRLRDLNSTNGTQLNGTLVTNPVGLHTGDVIQAGETLFTVEIEGDAALPAATAVAVVGVGQVANLSGQIGNLPHESTVAAIPERRRVEFSVETCASGLTLCRGRIAAVSPADLAVLLSRSMTAYLIVDFRNLGGPRPEELTQFCFLFDWFDPESAADVSPVIVSQADLLTWPELVRQGWGNNAVICLFSSHEKPALLAHLREVVRVKGKPPEHGGAILGYCWPGVMSMLLAHNTPSCVGHLIAGIDAVLVESADQPETWQLFGPPQVAELLNRFGFIQQTVKGA